MAERNSALRLPIARLNGFARRSGLTGFWRWWSTELSPLVPAGARAAAHRRKLRPVLVVDDAEAVLWRPTAQGESIGVVESARIALTGDAAAVDAAGRAAISGLAPMAFGGTTGTPGVVISLPPKQVLRRTLVLPAAVEENLKAAVGYDLDRLTPFKPEELYFDAAIVERDAAKGELKVDLASARRVVVEHAVALAERFGASVIAVVPVAPQVASGSRLNLLPDEAKVSRQAFRRWQFWLPIVLLLALAATAVILPLWQKRDYAITVMKQAEQARTAALESDRLRTELDQQVGDYNFALSRKYAFPGPAQVLDEMSRLLPDDTWLTQLEIKTVARGKEPAREVLLRGESQNAGKLISLLEDAKLVGQAAPRSPTTKIQPGPGEVFDLGTQLKALPPPATVTLGGATPAAAPAAAEAAPAAAPTGPVAPATAATTPAPGAATPAPGTTSPAIAAAVPATPSAPAAPPPSTTPPAPAPATAASTPGRESAPAAKPLTPTSPAFATTPTGLVPMPQPSTRLPEPKQ